ncbi:hypothetical protein CKAN_01283100 [Cinnamomum micranthum f. kanehirae]|uniref:Transmembrane protein n=1 Tax=Cinnamomum micranthum f. kanehirae TaxID=337451 RepID=A0A443NZT0_9MAGN|nr:hypothetical protein CKAN_01283100 [Cinnamomum micranthum f. kanehirae]
MFPAIKLHAPNPPKPYLTFSLNRPSSSLPFSSLSFSTVDRESPSSLTSSVGSPPSPHLAQWNLSRRHIHLLGFVACTAAISTSWLFFSAIPALLAFRRAAESLEKLMDVTREELPDTMAAIRLSGMEISDLTMELSDLGQEITQGVRNSTRAVRLAEDRLRQLTNNAPTGQHVNSGSVMMLGQATLKAETVGPVIARTARSIREGIVKGRVIFQLLFGLTRFSRWAINYMAAGRKKL